MVGSAIILKANKDRARREMKDALEFEMKLANVKAFIEYFMSENIGIICFSSNRSQFLEKIDVMTLRLIIRSQSSSYKNHIHT